MSACLPDMYQSSQDRGLAVGDGERHAPGVQDAGVEAAKLGVAEQVHPGHALAQHRPQGADLRADQQARQP